MNHSGVVHQEIQTARFGLDLGKDGLHTLVISMITANSNPLTPCSGYLCGCTVNRAGLCRAIPTSRFSHRFSTPGHIDAHAVATQRPRNTCSRAAACACYECHWPV